MNGSINSIGQIDLKYAAAFIDADGCISYSINHKSKKIYWEVIVIQSEYNTIKPLYAFQERWGGGLSSVNPKNPRHTRCWRWKVKGIEAAVLMWDLHQYFITKKIRCEEALEYIGKNEPKIMRILQRLKEPRP